jgi:hypothetical protein
VQNLRPRAGEPRSFEEKWNPDRSTLAQGHAPITLIPRLHRVGDVLILAGSATESTQAAAEYVTRPEYVTPFVRWMPGMAECRRRFRWLSARNSNRRRRSRSSGWRFMS